VVSIAMLIRPVIRALALSAVMSVAMIFIGVIVCAASFGRGSNQ